MRLSFFKSLLLAAPCTVGGQAVLEGMMTDAGFARCDYRNLSGGIVAIHTGYKV